MSIETSENETLETFPKMETFSTSPTIGALALALSKAQKNFGVAKKTSSNTFLKSKYADLSKVIEAFREELSINELALVQFAHGNAREISVTTRLMHSSGEWIQSTMSATPAKGDVQGQGTIVTYLRRYGVASLLSIAQDDDDGNSAVFISAEQIARLDDALGDNELLRSQILSRYKTLNKIAIADYDKILAHVNKTNGSTK